MKANELQINNFLQAPNVQFVIPVYQRNKDSANSTRQTMTERRAATNSTTRNGGSVVK